uniref:Reverse transcriptase domain-containing protein n=1 Tax=Panagrolaimus sp. PS1159 TaxID=55785 RepID=A0AC35GPB0_9BILA
MQGKVPLLWKQSHVIPIFKKGERHFPANYRPISLNCSLSAIPQIIVIDFLNKFFVEHKLIPDCQHGFTKGKSVTTQLLETFDYITQKAEKGIPVDIIFFDFKKAFDRLKHAKLFAKLKKANVPYSIIAWIQAFLTDRKFRVKIGETLSELFEANSGVPQGSKLGPLLFSFFIADLISFCETPGVENELFADDLKALSASLSHANSPLHKFLSKLETWTAENELEVAAHKCNVLHCLPKKNPKVPYFFNGYKLPNNQETIRDLGINVSDDLSWEPHINKIAKNATTRLFILFKALRSTSPKLLLQMYHTYVRPLVEFATPVFNPSARKLVDKLEKVQRVAVRLIFSRSRDLRPYSNAPYEEKLQMLGIESLETRRNKFDLAFLNDYISGNVNFKLNLTMRSSITRGAEKKLI